MFSQLKSYAFFSAITLIVASCSHQQPAKEAETDEEKMTAVDIPPLDSAALVEKDLTGFLDILYIGAAEFKALPDKRIVFKFFIEDKNTWALHGWSNDDNVFKDEEDDGSSYGVPDVKLKKLRQSGIRFGAGHYFGNLLLRKGAKGVRRIKREIDRLGATAVLFIPLNPSTTKNHIMYNIGYTTASVDSSIKNNLAIKAFLAAPKTNPSPPRNAKEGNRQEQ